MIFGTVNLEISVQIHNFFMVIAGRSDGITDRPPEEKKEGNQIFYLIPSILYSMIQFDTYLAFETI